MNERKLHKPELLAPAGDAAALRAALDAGADAVYFGAGSLNMRKRARNFQLGDISEVAAACRKSGAKAYLAVNTIVYENEFDDLERLLDAAADAGVDAIICWDDSVVQCAGERNLDVHLSTQASVSNSRSIIRRYRKDGIRRFVLARECSLDHVRMIRSRLREQLGEEAEGIELEAFIHGAMCVSVSGRCFMSEAATGESGNRGACLQPCRRQYRIIDVEGEYEYELGRDYVMSPKDLCTMPFIEQVLESGIASLKIEGRMRSPEYVSVVTGAYRRAIDFWHGHVGESEDLSENRSEFESLKAPTYRRTPDGLQSRVFIRILHGKAGGRMDEKRQQPGYAA
jgi:putative protease